MATHPESEPKHRRSKSESWLALKPQLLDIQVKIQEEIGHKDHKSQWYIWQLIFEYLTENMAYHPIS